MKKRKLILIIGMVDSIHLANWLNRFQTENIEFHIFPSRNFRKVHPEISKLIKGNSKATYSIISNSPPSVGLGYWDFLRSKLQRNYRSTALTNILKNKNYEFVHALEIQHAGYLLLDISSQILDRSEVILTNWGSDIYHFAKFVSHKEKIKSLLSIVDAYSAECIRDYKVARDLGFTARNLPIVPNSFNGIDKLALAELKQASSRKRIIVKGYGGEFGLASLVVKALDIVLTEWLDFEVILYSVTEDVEKSVKDLALKFSPRVSYFTINQKLSSLEMLTLFSTSRIYIGCSRSDGISTSFLESMACGTYPIQSNTSCADEWIAKGAIATTFNPNLEELIPAIIIALKNDQLVNHAQESNLRILNQHANLTDIKGKSREFYFWE